MYLCCRLLDLIYVYCCMQKYIVVHPHFLSGDCGVTHTLPNAKMSATGTTVGHTVTYNCTTGYKLIGSSSRTCQSNGQWSGTQPYCSRELCVEQMVCCFSV